MTIEYLHGLDEVRIIMVCMGNICRSPAAEVVLRQKLSDANITGVYVDSAGTGGWHEGDGADPRSKSTWERRGYTGRHTARQFQKHWFDERDLILVMDAANYSTLANWTDEPEHMAKVRYLRAFDSSLDDVSDVNAMEVPDPYYGGPQGFEHMLNLIERACDGLVIELRALR